MILKGSQRAGGKQLAHHLLNTRDNDHVVVHEVSGFVSEDVTSAFNEAYAISRGTRCKQYLFSLSLNPPETESVPVDVFEAAIVEVEMRLGLSGQPRAVIFHEKEGRRHAHCVWSRINADEMNVLEGLRGAESIAELCRREGIAQRSILQLVEGVPGNGQATPCPSRRLSQSPAGIG